MTNKLKKFIKLIVVPTVLATVLAGVLSYFILGTGIPAAHGLKESDVASVKIAQGGETVTLTSEEDIAQAVNFAKILSFRFGKADGESADTTYIFDLKDGSKIEIGANSDTIFKNGKKYLGVKDSCVLFGKCTQAIFSFETPPDGRAEKTSVPSLNELLTTELTAGLESIGVDTKALTKLEIVDPTVKDPSCYIISSGKGIELSFDADRNIVGIVNFVAEDNGLSAQDRVSVLLDKVRKLLHLGDDYICSDGYTSFTFTRRYPNGLENIYESVNVQVSSIAPAVTVLRRFNVPPNRIEPVLTETEAVKAAENNGYIVNSSVDVPLICYRPPDSETGEVRLAYKIPFGTDSWVMIDAENGDVFGRKTNRSAMKSTLNVNFSYFSYSTI